MAYLLRVINAKKWQKYTIADFKRREKIPAEPIGDLSAQDNKLSLFIINEDDSSKIPETIIAGFAATRNNFQNLEVVIIDENEFTPKRFLIKYTPGNTQCDDTNSAHRELVDLKANSLLPLAQIIFKNMIKKGRFREYNDNDIEKLINTYVNNGKINKENINKSMKKDLGLIPKCSKCNK